MTCPIFIGLNINHVTLKQMASNTNRKRAKVHMLPTESGVIFKNRTTGTLVIMPRGLTNLKISNVAKKLYPAQHLYFTTDEEIKEGDWFINTNFQKIYQANSENSKNIIEFGPHPEIRKIIATTDPKLKIKNYLTGVKGRYFDMKHLPQPSQAFIKKYCKAGGIYEVDVEYKHRFSLKLRRGGESHAYKLKVDSNNTITIHPIKDNWSKEEVIAACKEAFSYGVRLWEDWEEEDWKMWDSFVKENF